MYGYIYKITNIVNGKSYIGKTLKKHPEHRWLEHIWSSKNNWHNHRPLYRAINKYGIDNFNFEIIEKVQENELNEKEQHFIQEYNTYGHGGYNATLGGDGVRRIKYSDDEILNAYKKYKKISKTSEELNICVEIVSLVVNNAGMDPRLEHAKSMMDKDKYIAVSKDGTYIEFQDIRSAGQYVIDMKMSSGTLESTIANISRAAKGKRKTAYGFVWESISANNNELSILGVS